MTCEDSVLLRFEDNETARAIVLHESHAAGHVVGMGASLVYDGSIMAAATLGVSA